MPEPGITITRIFDAPRERVWKEWTEPEDERAEGGWSAFFDRIAERLAEAWRAG